MSKRNGKHGGDAPDTDLVLERLRRHLEFLGLTHTLDELDDCLAWAVRERPGTTALLEHVLGAEAAHKLQERITRRVDRSGLKEHKTLEAFDFCGSSPAEGSCGLRRGIPWNCRGEPLGSSIPGNC